MDIDDYWLPGIEHPIHHIVVENKIHTRIMNNIKAAKYITTTTSLYAHEISKLKKMLLFFQTLLIQMNLNLRRLRNLQTRLELVG
jgi:hypothetical protein